MPTVHGFPPLASPLAAIAVMLGLLAPGRAIASDLIGAGAATLETLEVQTQLLVPAHQPQAEVQLNRTQLDAASDQINTDIDLVDSPSMRAGQTATLSDRSSAEPRPTKVTIDILP